MEIKKFITERDRMRNVFPPKCTGCPLDIVTKWDCGGYRECGECKKTFWNTPLDEEVDEND